MTTELTGRLRAALRVAMSQRDRDAAAGLRSALGRLANAEAVPVETLPRAGAIEHSHVGVGAAEAPRREVGPAEAAALLRTEIAEDTELAERYDAAGRPDRAEAHRRRAAAVSAVLSG